MLRWGAPLALGAGAAMAVAPAFSGLALLVVLMVGAGVGGALFAVTGRSAVRPDAVMLRAWLLWWVALAVLEAVVLRAGDDLRWPTLSAIQDPVTTASLLGRFAGGLLWTAAGIGLVSLARRWGGRRSALRAAMVAVPLLVLAGTTLPDGPMLAPRDAPSVQEPGIDTTPADAWPASAWFTIAAFAVLALLVLVLDVRGRRTRPPGAVPDLLGWLMAPAAGRVLGFALWLWCGWHFLAR